MPTPQQVDGSLDGIPHAVHWFLGLVGMAIALWRYGKKGWNVAMSPFRRAGKVRDEIIQTGNANHALLLSLVSRLNKMEGELERNTFLTQQSLRGIPCFTADIKGRTTWVSRAWIDMTGMSLQESLGFGWTMAIAQRDKERVYKEWVLCCEEDRPFRCQYAYRVNGQDIMVECEASRMTDTMTGTTKGFYGQIHRLDGSQETSGRI